MSPGLGLGVRFRIAAEEVGGASYRQFARNPYNIYEIFTIIDVLLFLRQTASLLDTV